MQTHISNPLNDPDWDQRVLEHTEGTVFHSAAWARVLAGTYGHRPFYLHNAGPRQVCLPLMEVRSRLTGRRGVALPFSDSCPPLVFSGEGEGTEAALLHELIQVAESRDWKHVEIRGGRFPEWRPGLSFWAHRLDLEPDGERLWQGLSGSARRAVRKAESADLRVRVSDSEDAVFAFFRLHASTRRRHGVPPQPSEFFRQFHREIIEPGLGFVVLAEKDGLPVAAAVFAKFGTSAVYKFGASDEHYQNLRGNNMVMWKGIQTLADAGCRRLDFGRTSMDNEGLRRFKLSWGCHEEILNYYRYDLARRTWVSWSDQSSGIHSHLFGNLPLSLNRLAGRLIYPHLD